MIMDQESSATVLPRIVQPLQNQNQPQPYKLQRALSNDILFDLDPTKTLEALTSTSSSLSTVVEDVTPSERAFGIRAVIACKSIQEWLEELTNWTWPKIEGLTGFELSPTNERRLPTSHETLDEAANSNSSFNFNYIGCLTESQIYMYESRINQISDAMEDLRVDEIKRQVLDTHFSPISRPSSSCSSVPLSNFLSLESYSKINDFTAIITASILQALPKLSKLVRLMEIWRVRICALWKIPAFFIALEDTEIALKSGWNAINNIENLTGFGICKKSRVLSRETFDVIRYILQEKVMTLGQRLDFMLNILEGSQDTIPDSWLTRMEDIEEDYGEWVVAGERQVRRGECFIDTEIGSGDKNEETKMKKTSNSTSRQEEPRANEQQLLYSAEIPDSVNASELRYPEETQKSPKRLTESKCSPAEIMSEGLESYSITGMNVIETDIGKRSQEAYGVPKELSLSGKGRLHLTTSSLTVENSNKDMTKSKNSHISESLTSVSSRKKHLTSPVKKKYYYEQPEQLELNCSGKGGSPTSASNQSEKHFDSENIVRTLSHDIAGTGNPQTRDSHSSSHLQANVSKSKESNVVRKPVTQKIIEDKRLCLDGSSDCFEKPISKLSEVDEIQNFSHASNHIVEERCFLTPNFKDNMINHSVSHKSENHRRSFVDEINDMDFSDATERNEKKSVYCSTKQSILTPKKHQTFDSNFEVISSMESIKSHLNSQACNNYPMDLSIRNVIESYDISKESYVSPPVLFTDGSSESCFATSYRSKNRDSINSYKTRPSTKLYRRKRSKSLPSGKLNSIDPSQDNLKASKASTTHSAHPSLELQKYMKPHNMLNMIISSADVVFLNESGLDYTLKVSFDGKITYTNNNLIVSTISSSIDISALCIVTLEGSVLSLALVSPGSYSVIPPQPIFSVYYRGVAPIVIKNNSLELDFNSVPETNRHENVSTTAFSNESVAKVYPHVGKLPLPTKYPVFVEKSSSLTPAPVENSLYQDLDLCPNYSYYQKIVTVNKSIPPSNQDTLKNIPTHSYTGMQLNYPEDSTENSCHTSPSFNGSPASDKTVVRPFFQKDDQCSSGEQIDFMRDISFDVTPPDSPLLRIQKSRSRSFGYHSSKPLTPLLESSQQKSNSSSPAKTESFGVAKRSKNDQFQQQISSLLEKMPSLIRLSPQSEPKTLNSQSIRPKRSHRSLTPRSQTTSLPNNFPNSQTSTPLYTLVPANAKATVRSKHHNNNSEIRVYHLSRSNGEAPIKLFVRLVGEHGERVMVRVGGGWADLGEYLKEFASHHGRLTVTDTVRIHDPPSRKSSANTLRSSSVCREGERSSPNPRPKSVIEQRPRRSLEIPKTRRSTGMCNVGFLENHSRNSISHCPSTPVPNTKVNKFETPPSDTSSNGTVASASVTSDRSSRMSWNEEDFNLGLAGPRSKKVLISDHDMEWIESMKEKVRMASAEKDRRNRERTETGRNRGLSLDDLDKVGGTRRIFRRDGSVA